MVSGCSGKQKEDVVCNVVSEVESSEMDEAEDLEADMTTTEADAEPSTTEAPSESETVTTQPATPPVEQQPTTPEQTPPATSTEVSATEAETPPATDDRGNPADGSPVFEITFNIPQAEYVGRIR